MNTDSTEDADEEQLTDGLFGLTEYEAPKRSAREFLPWHRPRKHFVRHGQWHEQISILLSDAPLPEGEKTLKYLGLPGSDLMDIRHFYQSLCEPQNMKLRFLGFNNAAEENSPAGTDLNISLDEVRKLKLVDPSSDVILVDFCLLANEGTMAWAAALGAGPFDVINLDLCDGFGIHQPGTADQTYYNALNKLIALQSRQKRPWLLFLTTKTGKADMHPDLLAAFVKKYADNLLNCPEFKVQSTSDFGITDRETLQQAVESDDGHLPIFLTGLSKWLIGLSINQSPPSWVSVKSTISYRVYPQAPHDDLVSIAFRFEPTFASIPDPMNVASHDDSAPSECQLATKALGRIKKRLCADEILKSDSKLMDTMIEASSNLLTQARYDVATYPDFLVRVGDVVMAKGT